MSTFTGRTNTALLVIDVQNGVVGEAHDRDTVVGNVATLVEQARDGGTPVVWVQHSGDDLALGSEPWQCVPELHQGVSEAVVHKRYGDSFEDTDLEDVLAARGRRSPRRRGGADRRVHPLDDPRGVHPGLRRDAGRRCAHHRGPDRVRRPATRPGHRPHQPLLEVPRRPGTYGQCEGHGRRVLSGSDRAPMRRRPVLRRCRRRQPIAAPGGACGAGGLPRNSTSGDTTPSRTEFGSSCLSQWWPARFEADGEAFASAEHYMMWRKARLFGDESVAVQGAGLDGRLRLPRRSDAS